MWKNLLGTSAAVIATAAVGGVASSNTKSLWYRKLRKPPFQPPAIAFPIAWTALYADIAITSAVVLDRAEEPERKRYRRALLLNLILNGSWSWVFFASRRLGPAVVVAGALAISTIDLTRQAGRIRPEAGVALMPYALWCAFATVLTVSIRRRNPGR